VRTTTEGAWPELRSRSLAVGSLMIRLLAGPLVIAFAAPAIAAPDLLAQNPLLQDLPAPDNEVYRTMGGPELYRAACAACHGVDGTGAEPSTLAFVEIMPDFTGCSFATREPDADWIAVAHDGGPTRGFSPMMPAFGGMLRPEDLQRVMDYVRTLCDDPAWPRGELNFPRAMFTEKAYPEDELVWTVDTSVEDGPRSVMHEVIYEKRFGPRSQVEVAVPFGIRERPGGGAAARDGWVGGLGDVALGLKHALYHSGSARSILAVAGEVKLPTGRTRAGFGGETTVFETFVSVGQALPSDGFFQAQAVAEFPTASAFANELVLRGVLGKTFTEGSWGRAWTPMLEVQAKREMESGEDWGWNLAPQFQVTLNTRQHVMANVALLLPLTDREVRETRLYVYLLWDWFDGSFLDGW